MKYDFSFLQELKKKNTQESHHLEFSSGINNPHKKDEFINSLCREISGFANADGGKVIVGVRAKKMGKMEVIDKVDQGINPEIFGKEDLEQILLGNLSRGVDMKIKVIRKTIRAKNWYAVINVPQADTAVQSLRDYKYYRRRNFETVPMTNDEIVDVMNRSKSPILVLDFSVGNVGGYNVLQTRILNKGKVIATNFGFNLFFDPQQVSPKWRHPNTNQVIEYKEGKGIFKYRSYLDPNKPKLFPGDEYLVTAPEWCDIQLLERKFEITYEIFSENVTKAKKSKAISY